MTTSTTMKGVIMMVVTVAPKLHVMASYTQFLADRLVADE